MRRVTLCLAITSLAVSGCGNTSGGALPADGQGAPPNDEGEVTYLIPPAPEILDILDALDLTVRVECLGMSFDDYEIADRMLPYVEMRDLGGTKAYAIDIVAEVRRTACEDIGAEDQQLCDEIASANARCNEAMIDLVYTTIP